MAYPMAYLKILALSVKIEVVAESYYAARSRRDPGWREREPRWRSASGAY